MSSADPAHYHDGQFVSYILHIQYRLYSVFMFRFNFDCNVIVLIKSRDDVGSLEAQEGFPLVRRVIRYNLHVPTVIQFKDATVHASAYIFMNFWPFWLECRYDILELFYVRWHPDITRYFITLQRAVPRAIEGRLGGLGFLGDNLYDF